MVYPPGSVVTPWVTASHFLKTYHFLFTRTFLFSCLSSSPDPLPPYTQIINHKLKLLNMVQVLPVPTSCTHRHTGTPIFPRLQSPLPSHPTPADSQILFRFTTQYQMCSISILPPLKVSVTLPYPILTSFVTSS